LGVNQVQVKKKKHFDTAREFKSGNYPGMQQLVSFG